MRMLFEELDKLKRKVVMSSIVLMFAGIAMFIVPVEYMPFLGGMLGFVLVVLSVTRVLTFLAGKKSLVDYMRFALGLGVGLFGIALFVYDNLLMSILYWSVAIVPILLGVVGLYHSFVFARRSGRRGWWVLSIMSALLCWFGSFMFLNPWVENETAVLQVTGGALLYSALVGALEIIWIWPIRPQEKEAAR